jgi:glycerophosphoryl diester phosphodiesterase
MNDFSYFLCAHRGASGNFPENTRLAFKKAKESGVKWIETDLNMLADGVFIIFHDDRLGRTATGSDLISKLVFDEVRDLDVGSWKGEEFKGEKILTFTEMLNWQEKNCMNINYEIKCDLSDPHIVAVNLFKILGKRKSAGIIISSFSVDIIRECRKYLPNFSYALIVEKLPRDWRNIAVELSLNAFHLDSTYLNRMQVKALKLEKLSVRVYTVNDQKIFDQICRWGVDMIMSDYPEQFI